MKITRGKKSRDLVPLKYIALVSYDFYMWLLAIDVNLLLIFILYSLFQLFTTPTTVFSTMNDYW
jgi:hypothetical protein